MSGAIQLDGFNRLSNNTLTITGAEGNVTTKQILKCQLLPACSKYADVTKLNQNFTEVNTKLTINMSVLGWFKSLQRFKWYVTNFTVRLL